MHTVKPKYIKCMSEILETRKGERERGKHQFAMFSFGEINSDGKMELPCMGIFFPARLGKMCLFGFLLGSMEVIHFRLCRRVGIRAERTVNKVKTCEHGLRTQ